MSKTRKVPMHLVPLKSACLALVKAPLTLRRCPACGDEPFSPFMRGQVHRGRFRTLAERFLAVKQQRTAQCWALICRRCKEIVAYEDTEGFSVSSERLNDKAEREKAYHTPPKRIRHSTLRVHDPETPTTPTPKKEDSV